jgi:cytochrome o ubiquinol oxidase subunit 1
MTMVISIPTGVKVFNWLFTMFRGRITFKTPMLWFMGFLSTFILGGMTGVLLAIPGIDFQFHNSLFLVAHFHNMIIGGVLFGYLAAFSYWFPKLFGFMLDEKWGRRAFWCWLVGFFVTFVPLYLLGLMGATRRLSVVEPAWQPLLIVAGIGLSITVVGVLMQAVQLYVSVRDRAKNPAGNDPWKDGRTLEWSVSSPPPAHNFDSIPLVHARDPYWEFKKDKGGMTVPEPHREIEMPAPTPMGLAIAVCAGALGFGMVWHMWWLATLSLAGIIACLAARSFSTRIEHRIRI